MTRKRSPHPGVVFQREELPSGAKRVRARFVDPDTNKTKWETVPAAHTVSERALRNWGESKRQELDARRREIDLGAARKLGHTVADGIDAYINDKKADAAKRTVENYEETAVVFKAWAATVELVSLDDLTGQLLAQFHSWLKVKFPNPASANRYTRETKAMCNWWRKLGYAPMLNSDRIKDALVALRVPRKKKEYLRVAEIRQMFEAALAYEQTAELCAPVAAFLAFVLLTGCRADEACALEWSWIDFADGSVELPEWAVKTGEWRRVDLSAATPGLAALLERMKNRRNPKHKWVWLGHARLKYDTAKNWPRRLPNHGSPKFNLQQLRVTAATFLANAPSIWKDASLFKATAQLGHSRDVALMHYLGLVRVPVEAVTLEQAMGIADLLPRILPEAPKK